MIHGVQPKFVWESRNVAVLFSKTIKLVTRWKRMLQESVAARLTTPHIYKSFTIPMQASVIESTVSTWLQQIMHEQNKLHTITWSRSFHYSIANYIFFFCSLHEFVAHVRALLLHCFNRSINKLKWWSYRRALEIEMLIV